jgi:transcriptional regulator with XRE-family HTH domain
MKGKEPTFDGARLQAMRKWRGLSVSDVGRMSSVSARHIWRLEANQRPNVSAVTLACIARALDVDMEYLVGLSDLPQPFDELTPQPGEEEAGR